MSTPFDIGPPPAAGAQETPFWSWQDVLLFACLAIPSLVLGALVAALGGWLSPVLKAVRVWTSMGTFYGFWFTCLFVLLKTRYDRPFWRSLGWVNPGAAAVAAFFSGPLVATAVGALGLVLHTPVKQLPFDDMIEGPGAMFFFGLFSIALGPVTEELAFRGFLMPLAVRSLGVWPGIVAAALPFALLHGPQYAWTWQYVVLIGAAGVVFGAVRHHTRSTLASALMHSTYNLTFFAAFVARGGKA
jgi:membrane protease YdiL (CAAX protease family)